jgi:hypothetical protein
LMLRGRRLEEESFANAKAPSSGPFTQCSTPLTGV